MPNSRRCGLLGSDPELNSPRTPGPLGHNDAARPFTPRHLIGDTPSSLGSNVLHLAAVNSPAGGSAGKTLSEHAENKMWDLYKHHENQVGSQRPWVRLPT